MSLFFYGFVAIVIYFVFSWLRFRMKYDLHKIPSPPSYPIVGHLFDFLSMPRLNYNRWTVKWAKKLGYPKVMKRVLLWETALFVFDVDFVKNQVLGHDGMPKSRKFYAGINYGLTGSMNVDVSLTSPYPTPYFRAVRRAAAHAFSSTSLRAMLPTLETVISHAMQRIDASRKNGPVDLQELFRQMTLDVIGHVGFDQDLGGLDGTGPIPALVEEGFKFVEDLLFKPHLTLYMMLFPNSEPALKILANMENMLKEWKQITENFMSRPYPDDNNNALWASLRKIIDPDTGEPVTTEKISGDVGTLVIAGMDTTGHQLAWILAILSDHPETVQKIMDELCSHQLSGPDARDIQFEDLTELKYLNAVIRECMRLLTSAQSMSIRQTTEDMTISGYRVPKGTQIFVPENVYTQLEPFFDDPEVFRPERWIKEEAKEDFFPFSVGPRDCIGQRLAMFEMQVTLIRVLPKYRFKLTEGTFEEVKANKAYDTVVVSAEGGLFFDVDDRVFA